MSLSLEEWAERYARAWEAADAEAAAALFTEDATYRANPFHEPHRGHDGIRRYWRDATATQTNVEAGSTTVTTVNGGVTGLVRTLVIELAPRRVNCLHPAGINLPVDGGWLCM